ncbi:hypothetical protein PUNSTDRAFT_54309 [Punctularia strigosozonata HHB-11173 SS5]|uniref:uncharacterized protein n=1 Tax=Punctularia strigosozonata (strain HHB-11173) TaxID=741275 RepID=UPI00044186E2|nr:uncharacterized protein PUNSTDRAFT_54309 [Punctularia strigosozonata HHB-11173 SS5]EIN05997.1 hypothetical protein PUNSTDRAFT_54309 [Punctularia strigosozonata HHB-11173 SS5]
MERVSKSSVSCAECRRSKLKCDRIFPCQSCIRRGCAHLCPEGELTAIRTNQSLADNVKNLRENVQTMEMQIVLMEPTFL